MSAPEEEPRAHTFGELSEPLPDEPADAAVTPYHDRYSAPGANDDEFDDQYETDE